MKRKLDINIEDASSSMSPSSSKTNTIQDSTSNNKPERQVPPSSPQSPTTEEIERNRNEIKENKNKNESKQEKDKQKHTIREKQEKKCRYRPSNYSISLTELRGKIDRKVFYKTVILTSHDEEKKVSYLREGSQVQEYKTLKWFVVDLIHQGVNGVHVILHVTDINDNNNKHKEIMLDSVIEIATAKDWNESRAFDLFTQLSQEKEKQHATKKIEIAEANPVVMLKKGEHDIIANMLKMVSGMVENQGEVLSAIHQLKEEVTQMKGYFQQMLMEQEQRHSAQLLKMIEAMTHNKM
jgi:hypothetical protein